MGILQALFGGSDPQMQNPQMLQGGQPQPDSGSIVQSILSQRFQPSMQDVGQSTFLNATGLGQGLATPESAMATRLKPIMDVANNASNLGLQGEQINAEHMKNQMTAFQLPLMQRTMSQLYGGQPAAGGNSIPTQMQQNGDAYGAAQGGTEGSELPQIGAAPSTNANYGTPYGADSRIAMSKLAASMGNKPLSDAYLQDYQNDPNVISRKTAIEEGAKGEQQRLNKYQDTGLAIQKDINDDADVALKTKRIIDEMGVLRQNFTPGKFAGYQKALAEWRIGAGIGTPQDQQFATATQGVDKLTAQLTTQALKEFTSRGTQMEFKTFMQNNPNITMTPGGFDTLLQFMNKTSDIPLQKQQQFIQWKQGKQQSEYPDFDAAWNQNVNQNINSTLQPPIQQGQGQNQMQGGAPAGQGGPQQATPITTTYGGKTYQKINGKWIGQ